MAFVSLLVSFVLVILVHFSSTVLPLQSGFNSTSSGNTSDGNATEPVGGLGGANLTKPVNQGELNATTPGGTVDSNSSVIPSNQSVHSTPAPTTGSPPPVILHGAVTILSPSQQLPHIACPPTCLTNQGCPPPCPIPCCQQQPLQYGRSAVPRKISKKCQCKNECQGSRRTKSKCLVRCERGVVRKPGVYIEKWEGIDSFSIENLKKNARFPHLPTWRGYGTQFTQPKNWGENFGTRIRAYFVPKESGAHTFFISSDNGGELFLSNDEYPKHKSLIATVREERFTKPKQYHKYIEQRSWPVQLQEGHYYFIETLMKEFYDNDHLSVAVQTPTKFVAPITSDYLWTALPDGFGKPNKSMTETSNIDIIKIAAKAGARAGSSSGLIAGTRSAAKAGAIAGQMAGKQAGARAGEAAAIAAAQSVFAKTFNSILRTYKLGNLNFDVRLFGPNGLKVERRFRNRNNTNGNENTTQNHVVNIHLSSPIGPVNENVRQESHAVLENRYLPNSGTSTNNVYGNANGPFNRRPGKNIHGELQKGENPVDNIFGSSGQLLHNEKYIPIDKGSHPRQKNQGQRKSDVDPTENQQNDDTEPLPKFTEIPLTSLSFSSPAPDSRSNTPSFSSSSPFSSSSSSSSSSTSSSSSLEADDPSSPRFEAMQQDNTASPSTSSLDNIQKDNDDSGTPVFTTIVADGRTKNNSISNPSSYGGSTQSTRENENFAYYPKPGEDPDEMARNLVYEGGTASKIVFNAHYSIHSLDIPAIQLNITKNLCLNSFNGKITLKGQCQYFIVREGLLPETNTDDISLESACIRGHYLVQRNYNFYVNERDGTLRFAREATFALYKTMSFPFSLQIMSFSHYMWFICESKNKNPHNTEILLEYVNSKLSNTNRCSFTFLPMPFGWDFKKNCKGVLNFVKPTIPGQNLEPDHHTGLLPEGTVLPLAETCVALNFINQAGMPFKIQSNIKQDHYLVTGKSFKLKTIIKRPDLHHHITYRAEDPMGKNTILLYGDSTITILPQHRCDEFVPVEVTSKPGVPPGESAKPEGKPATNYHYHYHLPPAPQPPLPPPQAPSACSPSCSSVPLSCSHYCLPYCCKRNLKTNARSVVPRMPNACVCGTDCFPKNPNKTIACYKRCQEICKDR